jgi:hypothetical protein
MRKLWGIIVLLVGVGLLSLPFRLLGISANAPGDGGPNFVPVFQALYSLTGALVALIIAWVLLKRRS